MQTIKDLFPVMDFNHPAREFPEYPMVYTVARAQRDTTLCDVLHWLEGEAEKIKHFKLTYEDTNNSFSSGLFHGVNAVVIELRDMLEVYEREGRSDEQG